jgi:hypothetical protein
MRPSLLDKYPDVMNTENIGSRPNDFLYHAEATTLLRAAGENRGTLAGRAIDIYVNHGMCWSCQKALPYLGLELGNPTVTFIDAFGVRRTISNGFWLRENQK